MGKYDKFPEKRFRSTRAPEDSGPEQGDDREVDDFSSPMFGSIINAISADPIDNGDLMPYQRRRINALAHASMLFPACDYAEIMSVAEFILGEVHDDGEDADAGPMALGEGPSDS